MYLLNLLVNHRKLHSRKLHGMAYRTGTGKVVLCQTTHNKYKGTNWSYIPKTHVPYDSPEQELDLIGLVEERECIALAATDVLNNLLAGIEMLTCVQRHAEWFVMRKFRFTSSLSHAFIAKVRETDKTSVSENDIKMSASTWEAFEQVIAIVYSMEPENVPLEVSNLPVAPEVEMTLAHHTVPMSAEIDAVVGDAAIIPSVIVPHATVTDGNMTFCGTCGVRINSEHIKCSCASDNVQVSSTMQLVSSDSAVETTGTAEVENQASQHIQEHAEEHIAVTADQRQMQEVQQSFQESIEVEANTEGLMHMLYSNSFTN